MTRSHDLGDDYLGGQLQMPCIMADWEKMVFTCYSPFHNFVMLFIMMVYGGFLPTPSYFLIKRNEIVLYACICIAAL